MDVRVRVALYTFIPKSGLPPSFAGSPNKTLDTLPTFEGFLFYLQQILNETRRVINKSAISGKHHQYVMQH